MRRAGIRVRNRRKFKPENRLSKIPGAT
jgi:hypothetical protein